MKKIRIFIYAFLSFVLLITPSKVSAIENLSNFPFQNDVEPNKQWVINFNNDLYDKSIDNNNIYVEDATGKKVNCNLEIKKNSVIVKPNENYKSGQTYNLFIDKTVKATNKKSMKSPIKFTFKIKEPKKSNVVIKNNEAFLKSKNEIKDILDYSIKEHMNYCILNLKDYKGNVDEINEEIYKIMECAISYVYDEDDSKIEKLIVNIKYPYFIDNSYKSIGYLGKDEVSISLDKTVVKVGENEKINLKVPSKSKIKFSTRDPKVLKVDAKGNITPLKAGTTETEVEIERDRKCIKKIDGYEFECEWTDYESFYIQVTVVPKDSINVNKISDISKIAEENVGKDSVNIFINKQFKLSDIKAEEVKLSRRLSAFDIIAEFNMDYTEIIYNNFAKLDNKEMKKRYGLLKSKSEEVLNSIIVPGMTELEKEKAIYDYVVLNTVYDVENFKNNSIPYDSYTMYGVLINGKAVCNGYADTMQYLLNSVGIECEKVGGENKETGTGHAWNRVKIDGTYYEIDATWEPLGEDKKLQYKYFNLTEDEMNKDHGIYIR